MWIVFSGFLPSSTIGRGRNPTQDTQKAGQQQLTWSCSSTAISPMAKGDAIPHPFIRDSPTVLATASQIF